MPTTIAMRMEYFSFTKLLTQYVRGIPVVNQSITEHKFLVEALLFRLLKLLSGNVKTR